MVVVVEERCAVVARCGRLAEEECGWLVMMLAREDLGLLTSKASPSLFRPPALPVT